MAVKAHFGEEGNTGFVEPLYARVVCDALSGKKTRPFLADANVLYRGRRLNPKDHLKLARQHKPDLILMDIQMPVMDGYEATRRIKADPALKSIPIVAVTSYALSGDEEKTRAAGCDSYIAKPYSPRQMLAKVREILGA